jgi:hypothetical protein
MPSSKRYGFKTIRNVLVRTDVIQKVQFRPFSAVMELAL